MRLKENKTKYLNKCKPLAFTESRNPIIGSWKEEEIYLDWQLGGDHGHCGESQV